MKLKIGTKIACNHNRDGVIDSITISLDKDDIAGEYNFIDVDQYDTDLNYQGTVGYGNDYWCYFHQIEKVLEEEDNE